MTDTLDVLQVPDQDEDTFDATLSVLKNLQVPAATAEAAQLPSA